ncbi:uncharacterized protein [Oscarella lobularis]|uniref:uncharacterized protein n=1 Tax=Oscarella lobularis TaxID=121494 RepID=UPI00331449F5
MADVNVVKVIEQLETLAPFDESTRKKLKDLLELGQRPKRDAKRPRHLNDYEEEVSSDGDESEGDILKEKAVNVNAIARSREYSNTFLRQNQFDIPATFFYSFSERELDSDDSLPEFHQIAEYFGSSPYQRESEYIVAALQAIFPGMTVIGPKTYYHDRTTQVDVAVFSRFKLEFARLLGELKVEQGTGNPLTQVIGGYVAARRSALPDELHCGFPCILLTISSDANCQIFGACSVPTAGELRVSISQLSPIFRLYSDFEKILRRLHSLVLSVENSPDVKFLLPLPLQFKFRDTDKEERLVFTKHIRNTTYQATARSQSFVVKFVPSEFKYGSAVHDFCRKKGYAPELYGVSTMQGSAHEGRRGAGGP